MPNIIEIIKMAAVEAVAASNPAAVVFGTVTSVDPLKVTIEQRLILEESHLLLTTLVSDFDVDLIMDHQTEATSGGSGESSFASHIHSVVGTKTMTVKLGLIAGETVILMKIQGGQKYIILDRVR